MRAPLAVLIAAGALTACGWRSSPPSDRAAQPEPAAVAGTTVQSGQVPAPEATAPPPVPASTAPPAPASTAPPAPASTAPAAPASTTIPGYSGSVELIDDGTASRMSSSWRPGCPVALSDLRLVKLTHWGFDGQPRPGELVTHRDAAERVLNVFAALFQARFPIEQVRLIDEFGGDDDRSMAANNTSGFNCRRVAGTSRWSHHAYGRAIDINPVQNPYVRSGGDVRPPEGRPHTRRDPNVPGLIAAKSPVVAAFSRIGWSWGGRWPSPDYQHFSSTGR